MHVKGDEAFLLGCHWAGAAEQGVLLEFVLCANVRDLPVDATLEMNHELNNHWDVY